MAALWQQVLLEEILLWMKVGEVLAAWWQEVLQKQSAYYMLVCEGASSYSHSSAEYG